MRREEMADLTAFVVVAEERSFTKAAARLRMSQSAISQIVRRLEERLGIRLLARTTRSVAPTEAGERLVKTFSPMLYELDASIQDLSKFRDKPAGTLRITSVEHAAKTIIMPALEKLLPGNPDLSVELVVDYGLSDIVAERFDAGVRIGEQVEKDMIAVRIGPDFPMAVVAAPEYFRNAAKPKSARQLLDHRCINLRLPSAERGVAWRFVENGKDISVKVEGALIFNTIDLVQRAACAGLGIAWLPLDLVKNDLASGALVQVLKKETAPLSGYHLFYPSRRLMSPAFRLLVDALKYRG